MLASHLSGGATDWDRMIQLMYDEVRKCVPVNFMNFILFPNGNKMRDV